MSAPAAIVLDDIETRFGERVIHQHLNLTVQQGEVLALVGAGWQPIAEAPTERGATVDLWVRSPLPVGRGYRIADCYPDGQGSWLHDGQWVTGRRFYDDDGDRCFDPYDTGPDATVATHCRPLPAGPDGE